MPGACMHSQPGDLCAVTHPCPLGEQFCMSWCSHEYNLSFCCVRSLLPVSSRQCHHYCFWFTAFGHSRPSFLVSCLFTVDFSLIHGPGVSSGQSLTLMISVSPKLSLALKPNPREKPGVMKQHFQGSSLANKEKSHPEVSLLRINTLLLSQWMTSLFGVWHFCYKWM